MNKVYVVEEIDEYDGDTQTVVRIFDSREKARACLKEFKEQDNQFIEDIKTDIDNGNLDSSIIDEDDYFYAYDAFNFDSKTIEVLELEVK